jgi:hypothetical protein
MGHNSFGVGADNLCIGYSSLGPLLAFRAANLSLGVGTTAPNYKLEVIGNAAKNTGTAWINTSDSRTKKNISPYTKGLDTILNINPVYF